MMRSAGEDIMKLLTNATELSLTDTRPINIAIGKEPEWKDQTSEMAKYDREKFVTIFDTTSRGPAINMDYDESSLYEYPTIQIRVSANNQMFNHKEESLPAYTFCWALSQDIKNYLHGKSFIGMDGISANYLSVECYMDPAFLVWIEDSIVKFVASYRMQRKRKD